MTKSTGVGRGNYKRKPGQRRNRLSLAEKKTLKFVQDTTMKTRTVKRSRPYKRKRATTVPRSVIASAGVAGSVQRMTAGPQQPQEIKQVEINTIIDTPANLSALGL